MGSQKKELKEISVAVEIPNLKPFNQKVLIDKAFHIQLNMPQYVEDISNLACKGVPLAFGCKMPAFNTGFLSHCYIQEACDCSRCPGSFVLADVPANKNQFAKNRLKDISMMTHEL